MQRFFGVTQDTAGNVIPSVAVTVKNAGTATLSTLFSDTSFTPLANPFTGNADGTYQFYSEDGRYDVSLSKTGFTFTASETTDVLLNDRMATISPAQITGTQNNYSPTNAANIGVWRINSDATRTVTGIAAAAANQGSFPLTLVNIGSFNINLSHADTGSLAANRFTCANGRSYALFPNEAVILTYDQTTATWRVPWQAVRTINAVGAGTTRTNTNGTNTEYSFTVSGGLLGTASRLRLTFALKYTNTTGGNMNLTSTSKYGASTFATSIDTVLFNGVTDGSIVIIADLMASGATNTQDGMVCGFSPNTGNPNVWTDRGAPAVDSTVDQTLIVQLAMSVANAASYTRTRAHLEWLP